MHKTIEYVNEVGEKGNFPLRIYDREDELKTMGIKLPIYQNSLEFQFNQIIHMKEPLEEILGQYKKTWLLER